MYWDIGRLILERQSEEGWGTKIIDRLARDLRKSFPGMQGFSSRNLRSMRGFAAEFPNNAIVKQLVSQLPALSPATSCSVRPQYKYTAPESGTLLSLRSPSMPRALLSSSSAPTASVLPVPDMEIDLAN